MRSILLVPSLILFILVMPYRVAQAEPNREQLCRSTDQGPSLVPLSTYSASALLAFYFILFSESSDIDISNNNLLGALLTAQGCYEYAEAAFQEAIRLDPNDVVAYTGLGNALRNQNKNEEAETAFWTAVSLDPNDARAHHGLGTIMSDRGLYAAAAVSFHKAIELEPSFARAYYSLGSLYQNQNYIEEAVSLYRQALEVSPGFTPAQDNLAEAERLLFLEDNPLTNRSDDLAWQPENEPLQPLLRSIVRVVIPTDTGVDSGTGWVVKREGNRAWILTNRHVVTRTSGHLYQTQTQEQVSPLSNVVKVELYSEPPSGHTRLRLDARIVKATEPSDNVDLALLTIDNVPEDIQPLELSTQDPGLDTSVRIIGHHNDPWSLARGYVNQRPQDSILQLAETSIGRRSSGSPILNEENRVIGIVRSIEPPNPELGQVFLGGFSYGHPASTLSKTLTDWDIF